jgi:hypothetical protein
VGSRTTKKQAYLVEWYDHCSTSGSWNPLEVVKTMEPILITSIGFLVNETPRTVTLAAHWGVDDHNVSGDICILKNCVKRKKKINV